MEDLRFTRTELTEEQLEKLKVLQESENPRPRNREERRKQEKQNRRKRKVR